MKLNNILRNKKRVPLVLQYEMVECGAASLSMILRYFGKYLSMNELRYQCGVSRDGSNLLNIKRAAINYGLDAYHQKPEISELFSNSVSYPCIAWWNYNHFVVFESARADHVFVVDPGNGRYKVNLDELNESFSGYILQFRTTTSFKKSGKPERELINFLPEFLSYPTSIIFLVFITLSLLVASIVSPAVSGAFVQNFLTDRRYGFGIPLLWLSVYVVFLETSLSWLQFTIIRRMALLTQRKLSVTIARKLFEVNFSFFTSRFIGDIAGRLNLADTITNVVINRLIVFLMGLIGAFLIIPFVLLISWQLTVLTFVYIGISILLSLIATSYIIESNRSMQLQTGKISGVTVRIFSDSKTIKASGLETKYLNTFQDYYTPVLRKSQQVQSVMNLFSLGNSLVGSLYNYGTIAFSGYLVMKGSMNLAGFMAFQVLRSQITGPLMNISSIISQAQQAESELGRWQDLRVAENDSKVRSLSILDKKSTNQAKKFSGAGSEKRYSSNTPSSISVSKVNLSFSPRSKDVLSDITFNVESKDMVSIVGPSGSGKSTLIKVLAGLYTQTSGDVLYDGLEWLDYDDNAIRASLSYIQQDTKFFSGTIFENITEYNDNYTLDSVRRAASFACFDEVAMDLPQGYLTKIGSTGISLSGGQLQRLELARSLLKKPKILLLDEATSALDIPTEQKVLENLKSLGITLICVAHRLISAKMSDQVLILDKGHLIEYGSPALLLNNPESYFYNLSSAENT